MLSPQSLLLFIPAITVFIMLPGPNFALVSQISLFEGKRQGEAAALGLTLGICLHTLCAILGLSAILAEYAWMFAILKYAGAAYLAWLGIQSFAKSMREPEAGEFEAMAILQKRSYWQVVKSGFLTNVLNPLSILYFMVLYQQFLEPGAPMPIQFAEMGVLSMAVCFLWYFLLANLLGKIHGFFLKWSFQKWLLRVSGVIFVFFGIRLLARE